MKKSLLPPFFLPVFLLLLICSLLPASAQTSYAIKGRVTDEDGEALPGAIIELHELNKATVSKVDGSYILEELKPGTYHLHVTFVGYEASDRRVTIIKSDKTEDFQLHTSSVELREVLVEANPFKSGPLEQSLTIESVNRDFLDRNQGNTFVNSLEKIPGIAAINTGVGISKPVIRGLSANRIIVSDRGVKQEGQQWGTDHGLEIDQFDPQRIEIIKGPAALIYGSDGMGGVINIRPPSLAKENTISGEISGLYRSNNHFWGSSAYLKGNRQGFTFSGRLSLIDFADYQVPAERAIYNSFAIPIYEGKLKNTAGQERNYSLSAGISKNWGYSTLTLSSFNQQVGLYPGAMAKPGEYSVLPDGDARNIALPRQQTHHLKLISNTNIKLGPHWLEADLGFQSNNRREESIPHAHGLQEITDSLAMQLTLNTLSASLRYHTNWNDKWSNIWGVQGQYQQNSREGFEFLIPDLQTANVGAYHYSELGIGSKATVNGGVRLDYGTLSTEAFRHSAGWVKTYTQEEVDEIVRNSGFSRNFSNVSGAMGISWYPSHHFNAKLNLGKSFKIPSYAELASNGIHHGTFRHEVGDSTLNAEHGYQADLNLTYHTNKFHVSLSPFAYFFQDFIYLGPSASFIATDAQGIRYSMPEGSQVYRYKQHDSFFTGGETSIEYHLLPELHLLASAEFVWNLNLETGLPLPLTPPFSGLAEVEYSLPWKSNLFKESFLGLQGRFVAAQERVDRNEKMTPGYTLLNFTSGTTLMLGNQPLELSLQVQNLANKKYLNHLSRYRILNIPEQGRNISIRAKIPFSAKAKK